MSFPQHATESSGTSNQTVHAIPSLILAAHGSLAHETSNQPLFDLADRISARSNFRCITPAFLNGNPEVTTVLESVPTGPVVIVPVMTSHGYYLEHVLPGKLAENRDFDRYQIRITTAVGLHPRIGALVAARIDGMLDKYELPAEDTTIVLIGHGTKRNPRSGDSTYALADQIRQTETSLILEVAFLDQDPNVEQLVPEIKTRNTLIVPFLISRGPHTTVDVPGAFGLPTGPEIEFPLVERSSKGLTICDLPVGMYPEIAELCVELATAIPDSAQRRRDSQPAEAPQ